MTDIRSDGATMGVVVNPRQFGGSTYAKYR